MTAFLHRMTGLVWREPWLLALALLLPLAAWLRRRAGTPALRFAPAALLHAGGPLPRSLRVRLLPFPRVLEGLGLLALVLAVARPAERVLLPLSSPGLDIVLVLDTSSSMTADDLERGRSRLEVAREAAAAFVRGRPEDRIGLVTFARYPDLRCPPTRDHEALARILGDVGLVEGDGPEDATGIGTAVAKAAEVLQSGRPGSRVVVVLTDGEENVATVGAPGEIAPIQAAQLCERIGARVYAIAAGTGRPAPGGRFAKPDTGPIERMARRTGGAFLEAGDATALHAVYAQIDAMEKAPLETPRVVLEDRHLPFLLAGILLWALGRLLRATVLEVTP